MDKNEIFTILNEWNFWDKDFDTGIKRGYYLKKLKKLVSSEQIVSIIGARRSGKSYIMRQFIKDLIKNGKKSKEILFINFEDPRFINLDHKLLQDIFAVYLEYVQPDDKPYIFLDEVQEVKKWEKWVLMMHELKKAHIIISGSNAKLLSKELSTLLTGRYLDMEVFPLSFLEFLEFNNVVLKNKKDLLVHQAKINKNFNEFLHSGAFPKVVLSKNKSRLYASLLWLKKNEVINEQDLTNFEKIKTHRNELAHEMISYISNKNYTIEIELFSTLVNLIDKIEKWWIINVEMAIDSEPNNHEITENEIIPGISMSIKLLIDIALGLEKEPRYFYDHLVNSNKKA